MMEPTSFRNGDFLGKKSFVESHSMRTLSFGFQGPFWRLRRERSSRAPPLRLSLNINSQISLTVLKLTAFCGDFTESDAVNQRFPFARSGD
jgi:hypothetical protein